MSITLTGGEDDGGGEQNGQKVDADPTFSARVIFTKLPPVECMFFSSFTREKWSISYYIQ